MDLTEIDKTFDYYEKRYNLSKMALECGIPLKNFNNLSSRDKFLHLSYKLKESKKINLASFFFGKLFEISMDFEALVNKIDCLITLQEYGEAIKYNNIAFELIYETPDINTEVYEGIISFQKALISFYIGRYYICEQLCEEGIIKHKTKEFYFLLCATFIASDNMESAIKLFNKYSKKIDSYYIFLSEVITYLFNINAVDKALNFIEKVSNISEEDKNQIINISNRYYTFNRDKEILIDFFKKKSKSFQK